MKFIELFASCALISIIGGFLVTLSNNVVGSKIGVVLMSGGTCLLLSGTACFLLISPAFR
jgi:hypothetical protein